MAHGFGTAVGAWLGRAAAGLVLGLSTGGGLAAAETVRLVAAGDDWQLQVDGRPFAIQGVTWSYCPVGRTYDYDLFAEPEATVRAVLARDLGLMRQLGVNVVRAGRIPPRWVEHIFQTYGIRTIPNEFCGRYGLTLDGAWVSPTNYAEPRVREEILRRVREFAAEYRDVPGVLALALGNENNYGLEWRSAETENLPQGERETAKARVLYALFEDALKQAHAADPNHPVCLVNGDVQYLELIRELCPSLDMLAVNAYRGRSFGPLFRDVRDRLDRPVFLMEMGCDAWNAKTQMEDQGHQALFLRDQWLDLYRNAAGNGGAGNCLGGVVFEWADEWWKRGQQVRLDVHDTEATWRHEGYAFDLNGNAPNMNEEWFGLCAIDPARLDGVHLVTPRAACQVLARIWAKPAPGLGAVGVEALFETARVDIPDDVAVPPPAAGPLPFMVYEDGGAAPPYVASGYMGQTQAIQQVLDCPDSPHRGTACIRAAYTQADGWGGVVWQHPENDWGDAPGGYNLAGASALTFWARGAKGGEKVSFKFGLIKPDTRYPDTARGGLRDVVLSADWTAYRIAVAGQDLSRVKTGFAWVVAGQGAPVVFYLDDIRFE